MFFRLIFLLLFIIMINYINANITELSYGIIKEYKINSRLKILKINVSNLYFFINNFYPR